MERARLLLPARLLLLPARLLLLLERGAASRGAARAHALLARRMRSHANHQLPRAFSRFSRSVDKI